ncbi:DUF3784 domain-containing protein [Piscibacillus salipiscarius]|uniref:DUF3784 domain-containing protein n=1 Tax=Piscibacillus salipiscarius TaxID=299480 RepID=A0ABW5Q8A7_9BACI
MASGIIVIILLITIGVLLLKGKATFLIAGYNTLSETEREKIDEFKLSKFTGKIVLTIALSIAILVAADYSEASIFYFIGFGIMILSIIWGLAVLVKKDWFRR